MTPDQSEINTATQLLGPISSQCTHSSMPKTVLATGGTPLQTYLILFYMKIIVVLLERNCSTIIPKKGVRLHTMLVDLQTKYELYLGFLNSSVKNSTFSYQRGKTCNNTINLCPQSCHSTDQVSWRSHDVYLCWSEEADGIEVFHGFSSRVADDLKEVHLLL